MRNFAALSILASVAAFAAGAYNPSTGGGGALPGYSGCRLSLSSSDPAPPANQTAKTTLFFLPYKSDLVTLYDGSAWSSISVGSSGISLTVANFPSGGAASSLYDIFCYSSGGTATLEALKWTTSTEGAGARATALAYQNGALVKSGVTTRLYLGTVYLTAAVQLEDSNQNRFVWNYRNQVRSSDVTTDATASHAMTAATGSTYVAIRSGSSVYIRSFVTGWLTGNVESATLSAHCGATSMHALSLSNGTTAMSGPQWIQDVSGSLAEASTRHEVATQVTTVGLNAFRGLARSYNAGTVTYDTDPASNGTLVPSCGLDTRTLH